MLMLVLVQRICRILRDEPREAMDTKPCGLVVNLRFSLTITNSEAFLHFRCYMAVRCSELSLISVQVTNPWILQVCLSVNWRGGVRWGAARSGWA